MKEFLSSWFRLSSQGWLGPPLQDFPSTDATYDSSRVNASIEAMVREAPTQYLWIHRRFKRRPPGQTSPYRKDAAAAAP